MMASHSLRSSVCDWHVFGGERNKNHPEFHKKMTNYLEAYHTVIRGHQRLFFPPEGYLTSEVVYSIQGQDYVLFWKHLLSES